MIYRHVGPRRDHVQLDPVEERALAELERAFRSTDRSMGRRLRRFGGGHWTPLVRLAPWLLPIGTLLMVAAISSSVALSFVGALVAAVGLAATFQRAVSRVRLRQARRRARGS
jgi:hypothetical protein